MISGVSICARQLSAEAQQIGGHEVNKITVIFTCMLLLHGLLAVT